MAGAFRQEDVIRPSKDPKVGETPQALSLRFNCKKRNLVYDLTANDTGIFARSAEPLNELVVGHERLEHLEACDQGQVARAITRRKTRLICYRAVLSPLSRRSSQPVLCSILSSRRAQFDEFRARSAKPGVLFFAPPEFFCDFRQPLRASRTTPWAVPFAPTPDRAFVRIDHIR